MQKINAPTASHEFRDLCASWRPVLDQCLRIRGGEVFGPAIPEAVIKHMTRITERAKDPREAAGAAAWAVQLLLVAYTHLLNNIESSNPGIKDAVIKDFINKIRTSETEIAQGLPVGDTAES